MKKRMSECKLVCNWFLFRQPLRSELIDLKWFGGIWSDLGVSDWKCSVRWQFDVRMNNKKEAKFQDIYRNMESQLSRREVNQFDAVLGDMV